MDSPPEKCKIAVVVPTYNERENIEELCRRVLEALPEARLLLVDDNSPDGTGAIAGALAERDARVHVLHREKKQGLGAAYVAGFKHMLEAWPEVAFIFQMDADLSHDPAFLRPMLEAMQDADLVVGSRYVHGISIVNWPLHRLIVSKLGAAYARLVTGLPVTDATSGFKCYRRAVLEALDLDRIRANGYVFQVETSFRAWRRNFLLRDFPIIFYERQYGRSKLHLNIALEACWVVMRLGMERFLSRRNPKPLEEMAIRERPGKVR